MAHPSAPPQPPTEPPARPRRWLRVVLFVSLALNLLVLGMVAGAVLGRFGPPHPGGISAETLVRDLGLGPYFRALNDDDRTALRQAATDHHGQLRDRRDTMRQAFTETLTVLRNDRLDVERLRGLIENQSQLASRGRQLGQELLLDRVVAMTVAERRALADRLEQGVRRRSHYKKRRGKPDDD